MLIAPETEYLWNLPVHRVAFATKMVPQRQVIPVNIPQRVIIKQCQHNKIVSPYEKLSREKFTEVIEKLSRSRFLKYCHNTKKLPGKVTSAISILWYTIKHLEIKTIHTSALTEGTSVMTRKEMLDSHSLKMRVNCQHRETEKNVHNFFVILQLKIHN